MNDVIREFLLETNENLAQLDTDLIALEKNPADKPTLARIFRTFHSVKGTAGFIGLPKLQTLTHAAESLLSKLRSGELGFSQPIATAVLSVVDAIRQMLANIEAGGDEGPGDYAGLIAVLDQLRETGAVAAPSPRKQALESRPVTAVLPPTTESQTELGKTMVAAPHRNESDEAESRPSTVSDSNIRVDVKLLDTLMNLVGELVLARNQIVQFSTSHDDAVFLNTVQRLNKLTTELQASVMKTRMQPIGNVWSKFPRVVRDLSVACGKQVRFEMEGREIELDKTIIETIRDPLTHMVRNAVDHGIETPTVRAARGKPAEGRLALHAFHEGGKVIIEIADDGAGIDPARIREKAIRSNLVTPADADKMSERELLNLIFLPGFSTIDRVTQFSGRGVGMDVVRTNIQKIGGTVDFDSRQGHGTTVRLKIPLTLAIIPALTVTSGGERYCIPQVNLLELVRLDSEQARRSVERIQDTRVYRLRGNLLPLVFLNEQFSTESNPESCGDVTIVVLQADDRRFGLVVDGIHDTEEIVVKPLQKQLKGVAAFAGATIMGDGRVALILDVVGLAQQANVLSGARVRAAPDHSVEPHHAPASESSSLLVFSSTDGGRMALPLSLVARLEEFPRAAFERTGARDVVQYRGALLPLLDVARELRRLTPDLRTDANGLAVDDRAGDPVHVVVHSSAGRSVGLIVGAILDIVEEQIAVRSGSSRPGVEYTAVVQGRVTEVLDVNALMGAGEWTRGQ